MTAALMLAAGFVFGVIVATVWTIAEKRIKAARAAREQAEWEQYVDEAVRLVEEPIFSGLLLDFERGQA